MRFLSKVACSLGALVLSLVSAQCWAVPTDLVKLSGQIGFSCDTGNGGFEKDQCSEIQHGPFTLIYDPLIPDTDPSDDHALYRNAIRSFDMTISQLYRPALVFSLVGSGDISVWADQHGEGGITWHMLLKEQNNVVDPSIFTFNLIFFPGFVNTATMPTVDEWNTRTTAYIGGGAGASETDWLYSPLTAQTIPRPLPVPASPWLLSIGAAMAVLQGRKLRKSRH